MLSVGKIDSEHYYVSLTEPEKASRYHTEGGKCPGTWLGRGQGAFGVSGPEVRAEEFAQVLRGYSADGARKLVGSGPGGRRPGLDLTFSPPKPFSAMWAVADAEGQRELLEIHRGAVQAAFRYFEDNLAFTRRGKHGGELEKAKGAVACEFLHTTNRENQPQVHSHLVLLNNCEREDGTTGALDFSQVYRNQWVMDEIYRLQMTNDLERRMGVRTRRAREQDTAGGGPAKEKPWFEIAGVPEALCEEWSERRRQIEEEVRVKGLEHSSKAKEVAAKGTRKAKDTSTPVEELLPVWRAQARAHGFGPEEVKKLMHRAPRRSETLAERIDKAIHAAARRLEETHAHFSKHDLVQYAAREAQCQSVPAEFLVAAVERELQNSMEFLKRGEVRGLERYTTRSNFEKEKELLATADDLRKKSGHHVGEEVLKRVLSRKEFATISDEQRRAVEYITRGEGDIKVVSGMAGTGKTYMLNATRQVLEEAGFIVIGAAYTGRAAAQLRKDAHIETATLHRTLADLESTIVDDVKQHARGVLRAAVGKSTTRREKVSLGPSTCIIVDEAGMVGSDQLRRLLDKAHAAGAAVILTGDEKQVQPLAAGGPFKSLAERDHVSLVNITRQRESWAREAVYRFAEGQSREGLEAFASRGLLTVAEDDRAARHSLLEDWKKEGGVKDPGSHFMLAATRAEVALLNRAAQQARLEAGELGGFRVRIGQDYLYAGVPHFTVGKQVIYENDRVMLTRNSPLYGVQNGNLGSVLQVDPVKDEVTLRLDDRQEPVTLSLESYNQYGPAIQLGYAATTHKAQGASLESVYVLAGADRELTYVQVSRAKGTTRLYTNEEDAGEDLEELARKMAASHQKNLFHDLPCSERSESAAYHQEEHAR